MKIIILGGAGFVGRNLIRVLSTENYDMKNITVVDKDKKSLEYVKRYGVKTLCVDMAEKGNWYDEFNEKEIIINLAAQISSPTYDPFNRNNIIATENLLEAAKNTEIKKIIHFSSAAVLSLRKDHYAETKLEGEEAVKKSGLEYCILQPSFMYGPTDDKNFGFLIDIAKKFPCFPIPGNGKWPKQPIYIDDICHLVISIMINFPKDKVYSINGKDIIYFRGMIKTIQKELGGFKFRLFLPITVFKALMMSYQKLTGKIEFTPDQVDSLTVGEVFPNYPWWEEYNIAVTPFEIGVKKLLNHSNQV